MTTENVPHAADFLGVSRSVTTLRGPRRWPECRRCSSSLAKRRESSRFELIGGVRFEIETWRCRCGAGRQIKRELVM